jgi:hypothetical protein
VLPQSSWRFLKHLSLADNALTTISAEALVPLANTLHSLDLSSNLLSQVPNSVASLTALRALNLSNCMIDSLVSLTRNPLPAITALNLRGNRLQSIAGVEKLYPLERMDLRENKLIEPIELAQLTAIPDLREIWVSGNPFTKTHSDYRITIFNLFRKTPGYTEDIFIDSTRPSYNERRQLVERIELSGKTVQSLVQQKTNVRFVPEEIPPSDHISHSDSRTDSPPTKSAYVPEEMPPAPTPISDIGGHPHGPSTNSAYESRTDGTSMPTFGVSGRNTETTDTEYSRGNSTSAESQLSADKQHGKNPGLYTAETVYSKSATSALPISRDKEYITKLAAELFYTVKSYHSDRKTLRRISEILPDLLRAFALKLGHKAQIQMQRDVSYFVHKYRE